jgi:glutaminyl-tRNA synthetase
MSEEKKSLNFLEQIIETDIAEGLDSKKLRFRFPPEPNGYLHIGHAKAITLNFGLGKKYGAPVNLRFDDTNPEAEEQEFVDSIKEDIAWLGFKWDNELYASDYFEKLHEWAIQMIKDGKAYIDDQTSEQIVAQRTSPTEPGIESPFRNRSVEENLALFEVMKKGEGSSVLRAKIDMSHSNMNMRDPVMYRILNRPHHRTGDKWKIYPMYDWAHGQSDYIEGISHSLCSMEFENHRPLYDWYKMQVEDPKQSVKPKQREFARGNVAYMITSKRKLKRLVEKGVVTGWDDPRMPTIAGLRRRGYTPESIINFWESAGIAKRENLLEINKLEFEARNHLNKISQRKMVVVDPVKLVLDNYPENQTEYLLTENNPEDEFAGNREVPFGRVLYIEQEDFMEEASKKYFRLTIGGEVRLKSGYIIKGESVEKDADGNIKVIHATYDPLSKSGSGTPESQRKVKGTIHWVDSNQAVPVELKMYDRLFTVESPEEDADGDILDYINPLSLVTKKGFAEPSIQSIQPNEHFQFQRVGYFFEDKTSTKEKRVFNLTVTLKDTWAKVEAK